MSCLRVAVTVPVKGTFFYSVPESLTPKAQVGCLVMVPFSNRKVTGFIVENIPPEQADRYKDQGLKKIGEILDPEPFFHPQQVPFFEWMSHYYLHPIGQVIQSALPGGLDMTPFKTASLTDKGLAVLETLPAHSEERVLLSRIKDHHGKRLSQPLQKAYEIQKRGWIIIQDRAKKRQVGPLMRRFVRPKEGIDLQSLLAEKGDALKAKQEREFLEKIVDSGETLLSELTARFTNGSYLVKKWIREGVLESHTRKVFRNPAGKLMFPPPVPPKLHEQQSRAFSHIKKCLDKNGFFCCLLHGVTGSGKTEVYYRAAECAIGLKRQVIVMVPEIALAVYMEGIFRSRLGNRIAIYHSGLSKGERYDQWMRMGRGEVDLVIGARSALFAPLPRLGLIIVDEEHDPAYKQESHPRYQARDAAVMRAKLEAALVILGSGTPSVQSHQNCINARYHLLSMPERVEKRPLPEVEIVDMKTLEGSQLKSEMISPKLHEALDKHLKAGNQAMLFLNRRGFHRVHLCRSCGNSIRCPNCDVALTYHLKENRLFCHYCDFYSETLLKCSSCGREGLKAYGFGTEKLEQELKTLFPDARISRMDTDSTRKKGQAFQILKRFSAHEIDMLVGTQMITKGYDFPGVTLVGVICADLSLSFPDFRAGERTFQLLSQVAGRAGRGTQRGKVIIQTFNSEHYAVIAATAHDYPSFFEKERELRAQLGYPPFSHLACLRFHGNNKRKTAEVVKDLSLGIRGIVARWPKRGKEIQVLGPAEAPIARLKGKYRWQILVKSRSVSLLQHFLAEIEGHSRKLLQASGVQLILDVDPYQMI
jgi:primosomal protein N' (replication factor Y)